MEDRPQWHLAAALAAVALMSGLMAIAGLWDVLGWYSVELNFFGYAIESARAKAIWIAGCFSIAILCGYAFDRRTRRDE